MMDNIHLQERPPASNICYDRKCTRTVYNGGSSFLTTLTGVIVSLEFIIAEWWTGEPIYCINTSARYKHCGKLDAFPVVQEDPQFYSSPTWYDGNDNINVIINDTGAVPHIALLIGYTREFSKFPVSVVSPGWRKRVCMLVKFHIQANNIRTFVCEESLNQSQLSWPSNLNASPGSVVSFSLDGYRICFKNSVESRYGGQTTVPVYWLTWM